MLVLTELPDTCTAEEAASLIAALAPTLGIGGELPDVRTLRLWRTKQLLTIEGRRFTRRNLLEVLAMLKLRRGGLTQQVSAKQVRALDDARLRQLLSDASSNLPVETAALDPLITLQLLASGIVALHAHVRRGGIVGHTNAGKTGIGSENTPQAMRQAMAQLGRHYFSEGKADRAASVHQLLVWCTEPLATWAPRALAELPEYRGAILIDPIYRVPSEDCETIAETAPGTNLMDLLERQLHERLRATLATLGADADWAYTTIREFVGRHPMAASQDLQRLRLNNELPDEAVDFVTNLYTPVHSSDARDGRVRSCAHCHGLIISTKDGSGACILSGCRDDHPTKEGEWLPLSEARIALPAVLKYWVDPAREELRLYDALRAVPRLRDRVHLYPHSDWCDVALGDEVGVDIKDYQDPVRLAQRLNRSLGHLTAYPVCILAIARRRWSPAYQDQLREHLTSDRRSLLQVMSVDQAMRFLKQTDGKQTIGGRHHA